jgi:hypothetical protein
LDILVYFDFPAERGGAALGDFRRITSEETTAQKAPPGRVH